MRKIDPPSGRWMLRVLDRGRARKGPRQTRMDVTVRPEDHTIAHDKRPGNTNGLQKGPRPRKMLAKRAEAQDLRPSLLGLYKISLGRYTLPLTFSEEELFFSVPLSPDSPFLVVVSAFVPPL
jgi:hypothetical protein